MHMYVCMYVCMRDYARMYAGVCVRAYVCVSTCVHRCGRVGMSMYMHKYISMFMQRSVYVHASTRAGRR